MNEPDIAYYDVNCTLGRFPNHARGIAALEVLGASLDDLGVGHALVRHALGRHAGPEEANAALADAVRGAPRWTPCWVLNPAQAPDGLSALSANDVHAICLYPGLHGYPLCDWMVRKSLALLADRGALAVIELDQVALPDLYSFCQAFPGLRVIVVNTGYRLLGPLSRLLDACPNLYIDIATLATFRGIETLTRRHGAERVLFGTNTPLSDGLGVIAALGYATISDRERALIAGGSLERLLSEVRP